MFWLFAQLNHYRIKIINQFYGHVKVTIYIYVFLKYILKKTAVNSAIIKCLALLISPILFILIWILKISKFIISLYIRAFEANYFKMLDGTETIFIAQESPESKAIITTLFLVEDKQTSELSSFRNDAFYEFCLTNIIKIFLKEKFTKLNCSIQYKFGYFYMRKENHPIESYIVNFPNLNLDGNRNILEEKDFSMEQLRLYVSEVSNQPMPSNNTALWEVRIGKQKLMGTNLYPLIFRFHHIIGDAITIFNIFSVDFQNNHNIYIKPNILTETRPLVKTYKKPFITMNGFVDPPDSNLFCRTNGDKHVVWYTEKNPNILDKIKEIKQKRPGKDSVTVVDIILTCFLESLSSYFDGIKANLPSIVYTVLPMMPPNNKITSYNSITNYKISNKISLGLLKLPIKLTNMDNSLETRLKIIKEKYNEFKNVSLDYWFNRWQGTVLLTILPWVVQKWFINKYATSLMVSNIPGCDSLVFFGQLKVREFIVIDPNTSISGVTLMITSYEKRLNLAYTIDKAVIPNDEDVKKISNEFIANLSKLHQNSV